MNVHSRSVRLGSLLVVAALAGCNAVGPVNNATGLATANSTPMATPGELPMSTGVTPAGPYRLDGFDPPIVIELDGSWQTFVAHAGYASVEQVMRPPNANPYRAGTLIQVMLVDTVPSGPETWAKPTTAAAAVEAIRAQLGTMVVESTDVQIGGRNGKHVTVERPGDGPPMSMDVVPVLGIADGSIVLFPGTRLWIDFVEQDDGLVAIVVNSSIKSWDLEVAAAQPVLQSIHFEMP